MRKTLILTALLMPTLAFAAGGDDWGAPKPSDTVKTCKGVKVWDEKKKRCVRPKQSSLDQDQLYGAVRELAYAGRYADAQGVLAAMNDQNDDRVLTYWGFTHRKIGNVELANAYYQKAIDRNPDNLLARSYMGQGYVSAGETELAILQWKEIKTRGGEGTWPEQSLRTALETGLTFSY
ncbi:MAG: hypothetical protein GJ676_04035 [Rhodobacteraceae bacterium]|nr:hypothetical protein [Paracoccaceae bacterium]